MKLQDACQGFRLCKRHNPKHFYPNSFRVESANGRTVLVGRPKKHLRKNYRIVGILKPINGSGNPWDYV